MDHNAEPDTGTGVNEELPAEAKEKKGPGKKRVPKPTTLSKSVLLFTPPKRAKGTAIGDLETSNLVSEGKMGILNTIEGELTSNRGIYTELDSEGNIVKDGARKSSYASLARVYYLDTVEAQRMFRRTAEVVSQSAYRITYTTPARLRNEEASDELHDLIEQHLGGLERKITAAARQLREFAKAHSIEDAISFENPVRVVMKIRSQYQDRYMRILVLYDEVQVGLELALLSSAISYKNKRKSMDEWRKVINSFASFITGIDKRYLQMANNEQARREEQRQIRATTQAKAKRVMQEDQDHLAEQPDDDPGEQGVEETEVFDAVEESVEV